MHEWNCVWRVCASAQTKHRITYYNLGIRRETTADIRARWEREVAHRLPSHTDRRLVFSFGVNDTTIEDEGPRVVSSDSIDNARNILSVATAICPTLMIGPPPTADPEQNLRIGELSLKFSSLCDTLEVPYLNAFVPLETTGVWRKEAVGFDGSHPRAGGYAELARLIEKWPPWAGWFSEQAL